MPGQLTCRHRPGGSAAISASLGRTGAACPRYGSGRAALVPAGRATIRITDNSNSCHIMAGPPHHGGPSATSCGSDTKLSGSGTRWQRRQIYVNGNCEGRWALTQVADDLASHDHHLRHQLPGGRDRHGLRLHLDLRLPAVWAPHAHLQHKFTPWPTVCTDCISEHAQADTDCSQ